MKSLLPEDIEWVTLVGVLAIYISMRSKMLAWWERLTTGFVSAGLAYSGSSQLSEWSGVNELAVVIVVMLLGPAVLNAILTFGHDEDFIQGLVRDWARKRLGLKGEKDDPSQ